MSILKKAGSILLIFVMTAAFMPFASAFVAEDNTTSEVHAASAAVKVKPVTAKSGSYRVKISQKKVNYKDGTATIYGYKTLKKKNIRKISVTAYMYAGKSVMQKKTKTVRLSGLHASKNKVNFKFPAFGKYTVKVRYYGAGKSPRKTLTLKKVGVVAEEYNIAALNGTFGPLLFTMNLWNDGVLTNKTTGQPIPTVVALSRADAYNWSKLPKNVYSNPLSKTPKSYSFTTKVLRMQAYVKDLHSMNRNSKFHVYLADNCIKRVFDLMYANKIKDDHFDLTLLSDGTASYYFFNKVYNVKDSNPYDALKSMKAEWKTTKNAFLYGHGLNTNALDYSIGGKNLCMSKYTYAAVASQPNYKWWVTRTNGTFQSTDAAFLKEATDKMTLVGINSMLTDIQKKGDSAIKSFKALYHFSDTMFADAAKAKKKVMILMGTRVNSEPYFEEFSKYVMKEYGSGYMYYYKGHPATPTKLYPEKQAQLDKLGIRDVESSIAAELILFFYPNVYVSGMSNSTLNGSYTAGHTCAYLGTRLAGKDTINRGELFQEFFTKITGDYEDSIKALCKNDPSLEHSYLVEYNTKDGDHIAIYDSKANTLTKYIKKGDSYEKE